MTDKKNILLALSIISFVLLLTAIFVSFDEIWDDFKKNVKDFPNVIPMRGMCPDGISYPGDSIDVFFDNEGEMVDGGEYTQEVGRLVKPRTKSALSKRINTYEQTMKELFKSFMNQVNSNFKELSSLVDLLSTKVGSEISYDDDLQKFIKMFADNSIDTIEYVYLFSESM